MRRMLIATAALVLLGSCSLLPAKVSEIQRHPGRYDNHVVTLRGKATEVTKMPFMEEGMYRLDDGSGTILVLTRKSLPQEGASVLVRGKVRSALKIGDKSYGLVVHEGADD